MEVEKVPLLSSGERQLVNWSAPHPQRFKIYRWKGHGGGGGFQLHWKYRIRRVGCILLKTVRAGDSFRNLGRALCGRSQMPWRPKCVRHGAAWCCWEFVASNGRVCRKLVTTSKNGRLREGLRVKGFASTCLLPLSLYQARLDLVWMSSWYSAGYGWLVTDCSENGRRSGSWCKRSGAW